MSLGQLFQDLRFGLRTLVKAPGFSALVVLTVALLICSNCVVFSATSAILLRSLPFHRSQELVTVSEVNPTQGVGETPVSPGNFFDLRKGTRSFKDVGAFSEWNPIAEWRDGAERLSGALVSPNLFDLLGAHPRIGRAFRPEESRIQGNSDVVILSHRFWQSRFGGSPDVLESSLRIRDNFRGTVEYSIVGVMPPEFRFPRPLYDQEPDVWKPLSMNPHAALRVGHNYEVIARLNADASITHASAEAATLAQYLESQFPVTNKGWTFSVSPLRERVVGKVRIPLFFLESAVAFVLLIGCLNLATALLARGVTRKHEIAIRQSLGAGRLRVVLQLFGEALILSFVGTGLGLGLSAIVLPILKRLSPAGIPRSGEIAIDLGVAAFAAILSVLTALLFGLLPSVCAARVNLSETLQRARPELGKRARYLSAGGGLVALQTALSLLLLAGAGISARSLLEMRQARLGFNPGNILVDEVSLPGSEYAEHQRRVQFLEKAIARVASLPGVAFAAAASDLPGTEVWKAKVALSKGSSGTMDFESRAEVRSVTPDYYRGLEIPLVQGRYFTDADRRETSRVAIVNQAAVRKFWPDGNPIGKQLKLDLGEEGQLSIVGVVGDTRHFGAGDEAGPVIYVPLFQQPRTHFYFLAGEKSSIANQRKAVRDSLTSDEPRLLVESKGKLDEIQLQSIGARRFQLWLLAGFAFLAVALTAVGIYGQMSYWVSQRRHEFGIRMTLGALPRDILNLVLAEGAKVTVLGIGLGLGAALLLRQVVVRMVYGATTIDFSTILLVAVLLAIVVMLACCVPALRATRVDPSVAIRSE